MGITSTNYTSILYVAETIVGETPGNPSFVTLPTTGGAPSGNLTTAVSEVIRRDRMTDDLIVVDSDVGGDINYELSYLPYKPFLKALLQNTEVDVSYFTDISTLNFYAQATDNVVDSTMFFEGFVPGMYVRIAGTTNNNGIFKVTDVNISGDKLTVSPQPVQELSTNGTITGEMLRNGSIAPQTYTFLKRIEGIAATAYFYYTGCVISAMSFNFSAGSILNGTMSVVGRTETVTETAISGSSYPLLDPYKIMNSVQSLSDISITGLSADTCFNTLNLTVNNNVQPAKCIGTLGAHDLASFTLDITADIELYFEDIVTYTLYKNSSSFSLSFRLTDGDGNLLIVTLPACKFESLDSPIDGKDNFYMLSGSMRAIRDPVTNCMIQFDFFNA